MNKKAIVIFLALLFATNAEAGRIYGNLLRQGQPMPANTPVEVVCGNNRFAGTVDQYGRYNVNVTISGPCVLSVNGISTSVVSYDEATRYNFELINTPNGMQLKRN